MPSSLRAIRLRAALHSSPESPANDGRKTRRSRGTKPNRKRCAEKEIVRDRVRVTERKVSSNPMDYGILDPMTSAQLILVSVTSAVVAVFMMLVVATILRARAKEDDEPSEE